MARDLADFSAGGSNNVMVFSCPASSENQYSVSVHFFEQAAGQNIQRRVELKIPETNRWQSSLLPAASLECRSGSDTPVCKLGI
jgi:hypothetical protein